MNKFVGVCVAILSLSVIGQANACDECYGEWKVVSSPLLVRSNDCDCTLTWRKGRVSLVTIDGFCLIKKVGKGVNRGFKKAELYSTSNKCNIRVYDNLKKLHKKINKIYCIAR